MSAQKKDRNMVLPDDHLRGQKQPRSNYDEFMTPTIMRRWVQQVRENRSKKR